MLQIKLMINKFQDNNMISIIMIQPRSGFSIILINLLRCWLYNIQHIRGDSRSSKSVAGSLYGAEVSASGWGSGGPRFQSHPRLTFQSCSRYQLNQLGSKAASESTFKKSNTCGVSNNRLYFTLANEFRHWMNGYSQQSSVLLWEYN